MNGKCGVDVHTRRGFRACRRRARTIYGGFTGTGAEMKAVSAPLCYFHAKIARAAGLREIRADEAEDPRR